MWIKIIGVLFVTLSCAGLGADAAHKLKKRLRLLETLKHMVIHLKGEILYANAPLAEAFERTGNRNPGKAGDFFREIAAELIRETGESFDGIWKEHAEKFGQGTPLSSKEKEQLISFGEHLGYLDRDMQEKTILLYLEDLEHSITSLREQEPQKCRLFMSLGVMSGLFLAVVLV